MPRHLASRRMTAKCSLSGAILQGVRVRFCHILERVVSRLSCITTREVSNPCFHAGGWPLVIIYYARQS